MPAETLDRYFPILFGLSVLWIAAWIVASIFYRRSRGKPIMFPSIPHAEFIETAASGHSNRTWYTKLGGASRCLVVAVTGQRLIIHPRFPFNLMFLPEVYGLEHDVSAERVTRAEVGYDRPGSVRLEFRDPGDRLQDVTLYLQKPSEFVQALGRPTV
jgi:hypothetical protein